MPTDMPPSSITDDCRIAREQAQVAQKEAAAAEEEFNTASADLDLDPFEERTVKARATKRVAEHAKAAGHAARKAREAATRARAALRVLGERASDPAAGLRNLANAAADDADAAFAAAEKADEFRKKAISTFAVVEELEVKEFFETHKEQIFARLEECDRIAQAAPTNSSMTFIAESLPIIHSIIQVGTNRPTLHRASQWVRDTWGDETDPLITLSALLFIYVANEGAKEKKGDEGWERINERVQKLMRGP